jgi:hypothetical protein
MPRVCVVFCDTAQLPEAALECQVFGILNCCPVKMCGGFSLASSGNIFDVLAGYCVPKVATWLILPVVICLSQRLSHACLSISNCYSETANGSLNQL